MALECYEVARMGDIDRRQTGVTALSRVLSGAVNSYSRTSPRAIQPRAILPQAIPARAILAATWPPIPNPALPRRLATVASSLGGRALHWLAVPTGGDVPAGRRAPKVERFRRVRFAAWSAAYNSFLSSIQHDLNDLHMWNPFHNTLHIEEISNSYVPVG
jgi:hypothetical protein